jgi:D-lactate dehydrogenase
MLFIDLMYNKPMKITFFDVPKDEQPIFLELFAGMDVTLYEERLTDNNIEKAIDADVISVFISSVINKDIIDFLPNLKFIATRSTGFDHIDLDYCKSKGIQVSNVPAYGSHTVAEFAFGLLLSLSRKIFEAGRQLKEEGDFSIYPLQGFDLNGKTMGVVGTGKIGKNSIKIAKGFGMNVVAYDLYPDMAFAKENDFAYKSLAEVLAESDAITLHAPYTKENHHLINKENVLKMKKGVYLINTARGELIDTDALILGLKEGIIAGAGLDVMEGERELKDEMEILASEDKSGMVKDYKTLLEDRVLMEMPNVIITPHVAFYSKEAEMEIIKMSVENVKGFVSGKAQNLVSA